MRAPPLPQGRLGQVPVDVGAVPAQPEGPQQPRDRHRDEQDGQAVHPPRTGAGQRRVVRSQQAGGDCEAHRADQRCDDGAPHVALVPAPEERDDRDRSRRLQQDDAQRRDADHAGGQRQVRVEPGHREGRHHHGVHRRLGQARDGGQERRGWTG